MKDKLITIPLTTGFAENAKLSKIEYALFLEGYYVVEESDWEAYKLWKNKLENQNHNCKEYEEQQ